MPDSNENRQVLALAAIQQASAALNSLANLAADGEHDDGEENTVELLADALKLAIEAEAPTESEPDEVNQLHGALVKFLDGWVG